MPAPEDLQNGGNVGRLWDKIDNICSDITTIKTDIAFIKGRLVGEQVRLNGSAKIKTAILSSLIIGLSGVVVAVIAFFKPS